MTERPILFSAPMVRAILAGAKTQTRRVVKPQPADDIAPHAFPNREYQGWMSSLRHEHGHQTAHFCPYGQPGDRLWVREAFAGSIAYERNGYPPKEWGNKIWYIADGEPRSGQWTLPRPSIHMPRALSRITLEVTGVRVERLQDISEADAQAEGAPSADLVSGRECIFPHQGTYRWGFRLLWESINGPGSWDANPWMWCVEFRRVDAAAGAKP